MAPEILLKRSYTPSADLWSTGVILYECLFGSAPYSSKTIDELLHKIKVKQKIEVSPTARISLECRDLLTRLLVDEPDKRITFEEFFSHSFINVKQSQSTDKVSTDSGILHTYRLINFGFFFLQNLMKAIEIVSKAVEEDGKRNYREAYYLYCQALQYFVPIITSEADLARKLQLQDRAMNYLERAEEIKNTYKRAFALQRQSSKTEEPSGAQPSTSTSTGTEIVESATAPSPSLTQLCTFP